MNKEMKPLHIELSLADANRILEALGHLPYVQVFGLIESIRTQALAQMRESMPVVTPEANGQVQNPEMAFN